MYPAQGSGRDLYEVANQLGGYVGPNTPKHLADFLIRESFEAAHLADEIVRLRSEAKATYEVAIKPLEWQYGCAQSAYGRYVVESKVTTYARLENMQVGLPHSHSVEDAQAAANKDYEARIGATLILPAIVSLDREVAARAIDPGSWATVDTICMQFGRNVPEDQLSEDAKVIYEIGVRTPEDARYTVLAGNTDLSVALRNSLEAAVRVITALSVVKASATSL